MTRARFHVVHRKADDTWWVRGPSPLLPVMMATQHQAIQVAIGIAKELPRAQVLVHRKKDGRIRAEWTYPRATDPRRWRG